MTLAPEAWALRGPEATLALVRMSPAPQKHPPAERLAGSLVAPARAEPSLGQAQNAARHIPPKSALPVTAFSSGRDYDRWYLRRLFELEGILVLYPTSVSFYFSSLTYTSRAVDSVVAECLRETRCNFVKTV